MNQIPAARIRVLLEPIVARSSVNKLSEQVGCNHHILAEVMNGERETVSLGFVDRLTTKLGRPDWLHVELADLFEEPQSPELAAALKRAEAAERRATKWYGEVKRLRKARAAWENKYRRLRQETEQWRQAERYRARTAAKRAA